MKYEIHNGDCLEVMSRMPDGSVDLIMTSPPYAEQRFGQYGGVSPERYPDWMLQVVSEGMRVLKDTGSFVLNIKEHVDNGTRDQYVMRTLLAISEKFRWVETYILVKKNPFPTGSKKRLKDAFEYCFHFAKTNDYKFFPERALVPADNKFFESESRRTNTGAHNVSNGSGMNMSKRVAPTEFVRPSNVIVLPIDSTNHDHPATFPVGLPERFIRLMTDEGDVVLDPFMGSGTTGVASKSLGRSFIGIEQDAHYCDIASARISREKSQLSLFEVASV